VNSNFIEHLAELASVRDEQLVAETQTPEARALLSEILATPVAVSTTNAPRAERPSRVLKRGRWLTVPALAAAVAAVAVLVSTGSNGTSNAAAATLNKAAMIARMQAPLLLGSGQYLYTKSVDAYTSTTTDGTNAYTVLIPHVREIWLGPDGGRLYETSGAPQFLTAADRQDWLAAGSPNLTQAPMETKLPPTPALDLPTDPDALYTRLTQQASATGNEASATGNPLPVEMFNLIGDSLRESAATPAQRAALYQVAARLPGIELLGTVTDSAGRTGIGVAISDHGIRFTLILDPNTSALLAEENIALAGNQHGYPAGTRTGYSTYLVQQVVNSDSATS
jgi:hypothetical protein